MNNLFTIRRAPEGDGAAGGAGDGGGAATADAGRSLLPPEGQGAAGAAAAATGTDGATGTGTPAAISKPWWDGYIKTDGTLDKTRLSALPDDMKDAQPFLARLGKLDDVFKSYAHAQKLVSQKGLTPLREGATEEERTDHMKRLALVNNVPDKPEGYGLKKPDDLPDDRWDEPLVSEMSKVFHKWAMPPEAVREVVGEYTKLADARIQEFEAQQAQAEDAHFKAQEKLLNDEFGPFKQEKFAAARSGARWMGLDPDSAIFKSNAALIIAAAKVGEKIGEARHVDGGSADTTQADPQAELDAMTNDPTNKYYDVLHNPEKQRQNPRLYEEANHRRVQLGQAIARKKARMAGAT